MTLNQAQIDQLLRPINQKRVGHDNKGFSHLEAYDVRAHLIRIFGPCGWSADTEDMQMVFETVHTDEKTGERVSVGYRAKVVLTVAGASYTEWAMGDCSNFPIKSRGDAHDMAIKTAESQALKRCAVNLGDQFGLSLYAKGSTNAIVGKTLAYETQPPSTAPVDAHVTEVPAEDTAPEPAVETRQRTEPAVIDGAKQTVADQIAARVIAGPGETAPKVWVSQMVQDMARQKVQSVLVDSGNGERVQLKVMVNEAAKTVAV